MEKLLIEFFSEEMPAKMLSDYSQSFFNGNLLNNLKAKGIRSNKKFKIAYTPRRISGYLEDFYLSNHNEYEEIKGPRINAPEIAISGFLKKYTLNYVDQLEKRGEFYYLTRKVEQLPIQKLIKLAVEEAIMQTIWPKSMLWGNYEARWIRPLHSILCLYNQEIIPVTYCHLRADRKTQGHRRSENKFIEILSANWQEYLNKMRATQVIVDIDERKRSIEDQIQTKIKDKNLKLIEDHTLLDEICNLVEFPFVYIGSIANMFMQLPEEVLVTTLRNNQRYLMLRDQNTGKIAPHFIIVSNISGNDGGEAIIQGNQKVLNARLSDALFFFNKDKQTPARSRLEKLKSITFHEKIGSVFDKVQSSKDMISKLATVIGFDIENSLKAVELAKTDLVTEMVSEFPELQGIMGYYYAKESGESEDVAISIRDHYKPMGPNDSLPSTMLAAVVALADKLDTLNQMFKASIKPTGSKDPFALRRAANGVIRIINHYQLPLDYDAMRRIGIREDVVQFISERNV